MHSGPVIRPIYCILWILQEHYYITKVTIINAHLFRFKVKKSQKQHHCSFQLHSLTKTLPEDSFTHSCNLMVPPSSILALLRKFNSYSTTGTHVLVCQHKILK